MNEGTRPAIFSENSPGRHRSAVAVAGVTLALALAVLIPGHGGVLGAQTLPSTTCVGVTIPTGSTTSLLCTNPTTSTTAVGATTTAVGATTTTTRPATTTTTTASGATTTSTTASGATTTSTTASGATTTSSTTGGAILRLSSTTVTPGQRVTLAGDRLPPNVTLQMNFLSAPVSLGSVTTNATGSFQATITIPSDAVAGAHQINVTDSGTRVLATVDLTVNRSTTATGGLARTGANALGVALLAVTVILLGWAFLSSHGAFDRRRWQ